MKIKDFNGLVFSLAILSSLVLCSSAQADSIVMKAYKTAFPGTNPKCINCHLAFYPWDHPWNPYGQTVKKAVNASGVADKPTENDIGKIADVFKKIGKIEDFKAAAVKQ